MLDQNTHKADAKKHTTRNTFNQTMLDQNTQKVKINAYFN